MKTKHWILIAFLSLGAAMYYFVDFDIGEAKFEKENLVVAQSNSFRNTITNFVDSADIRAISGKHVFFNTWATWCGPCNREIPVLNKLKSRHARDTNIVFVSYCSDKSRDGLDSFMVREEKVFDFYHLNSKQGLRIALNKLAKRSNPSLPIDTLIDGVPMSCIIDKNDKLVYYKNKALRESDLVVLDSIISSLN